jgi:hypothetical protein
MPIVIYSESKPQETLAKLCSDEWGLPKQVSALEAWLGQNCSTIRPGRYVADIGFSVRKEAGGGGAALSSEMLRTLADHGVSLFLSEYVNE